jgi:hypothetical protein
MVLVMQTDAPFWDSLVFDGIDEVDVEAVTAAIGTVEVVAKGRAAGAACPGCGCFSDRVHDRYQRRLKDLPLAEQGLAIRLTVRRFICGSADCPRRTFAEPFLQLTAPYARFTTRLNRALEPGLHAGEDVLNADTGALIRPGAVETRRLARSSGAGSSIATRMASSTWRCWSLLSALADRESTTAALFRRPQPGTSP